MSEKKIRIEMTNELYDRFEKVKNKIHGAKLSSVVSILLTEWIAEKEKQLDIKK